MIFSVVQETASSEPFAYWAFSLSGPHHRNRLIPDDRFSEQIPEIVRRLRMRYLLGFHVEPSHFTQLMSG
jgi:hypothetical protein